MEGLHQHVYGGSFLVSLHLSHDVLREDRTQAAEDITSKSRSAQLHSLHSNGQEVLLHPLSLLHLFCALSRGQSILHKNADHRHFVFLDVCRWQNQRGGSAVFCPQQLPGPCHVLPVILFSEEGGAALGEQHDLLKRCYRHQWEQLHCWDG